MQILTLAIASLAPTIAALAAWRRPRGVAALERIEARIEDILDWQVAHDRTHLMERRPRIHGGMQ